jgi:hypothetical protein
LRPLRHRLLERAARGVRIVGREGEGDRDARAQGDERVEIAPLFRLDEEPIVASGRFVQLSGEAQGLDAEELCVGLPAAAALAGEARVRLVE